MTHEEKTRLIAEFMGEVVYDTREEMNAVPLDELKPYYFFHQLQYSKSYDRSMPVWHKFRDLLIDDFEYAIHCQWIKFELYDGNEGTLFNALAEAIEWYNMTKK